MRNSYEPKVGDFVKLDKWAFSESLKADDGFKDSEFPGCEFRLPSKGDELAVNIKVTGGDHMAVFHGVRCRCKIEFVKDGGEPSTFTGGWLYHE